MEEKTKLSLIAEAKENPWRMFTGEEISLICGIGERTLNAMRAGPDNPFCAGKCRPEKIVQWFAEHPGWQPSKK